MVVTRKGLIITFLFLAGLIVASAAYVYIGILGEDDEVGSIREHGSILDYDPPMEVPTFQVQSTEGEITFPIPGKLNVVTPQYLSCPDICPLETIMMTYAMAKLVEDGNQDKVVFVTIDVDPWRDTPEAARNYIEAYAGDLLDQGVTWIWIVDEVPVMKQLWDTFSLYVQKDNETGLVTHTGGFLIISPDGKLIYFVSPSSKGWEEPDKFAVILYETINRALEETGLTRS